MVRRMSVAEHHLDSGVSEHRGQRDKFNPGRCRTRSPGVPEVIKPERNNLAVSGNDFLNLRLACQGGARRDRVSLPKGRGSSFVA